MKQYKRKLIKFSHYSLCVTIPKNILDRLDLNRGDEVAIELRRGKIVIVQSATAAEVAVNKANKAKKAEKGDWEPLPQIKSEE